MSKASHFFFFLALLISVRTYSQISKNSNAFTITGEFKDRDTGTIILWYNNKNYGLVADTSRLKNGRFDFSGTTSFVSEALLWADPSNIEFDNPSMIRFLLEPKTITIFGKKGDEGKSIIRGSSSQTEKENWDKKKAHLLTAKAKYRSSEDSLFRLFRNTKDELFRQLGNEGYRKRDSINTLIQKADIAYAKSHKSSYLSAYLLSRYTKKLPVDSLQSYYTNLSSSVKKSAVAHDVLIALYPLTNDNEFRKANPLISTKFDERLRSINSVYGLNLKDTSGKTIPLSRFKGQYLVLDFWTRSCQPCIENIPAFNQFAKKRYNDSIQFIAISLDTNIEEWKKAIKKYNFQALHLSDSQGFLGLVPVYSKVLWVPKYVVVNKEGKIINYEAPHPKNPEFKTLLDGLLNKP